MTQFFYFTAPDIQTAIHNHIAAKFGSWDENDQYIEPDLEIVRAWATNLIRQEVGRRLTALEESIGDSYVQLILLYDEVRRYVDAGRPADPAAAQYPVSDALATERGVSPREALETFLARWLDLRSNGATILATRRRLLNQIIATTTISDIVDVLAVLFG